MPTYVYRCPEDHRKEITHGIKEDPVITCEICGAIMRRVPQVFRIAFNPGEILADWMDENYRQYRKYPKNKQKRFHPDNPTRPGKPIPLTSPRR